MDSKKILKVVEKEATKILNLLGVEEGITIGIGEGDEGITVIKVEVEGENLGFMIGNRGRHMQSLQYILSNIVRNQVKEKDEEARLAILLDISGYRKQRDQKLESLALQKADDARILGDAVDLPPMSPGERRTVHMVLGKFDDIKTESQGDGRDRFVRILPVSEKDLGIVSETEDNVEEGEEEQE